MRFWVIVGLQSTSRRTLVGLGSMVLRSLKMRPAPLVMAVADYAYQRRTHEESLKMSKKKSKRNLSRRW